MRTVKEAFNESYEDYLSWNDSRHSEVSLKIIDSLSPNSKVLSLGCGAGREVKELVKHGHKVTGVNIAENMIKKSKEIEPKAKYFCEDATIFAKKNKNKLKFDYIIGLFSFLNYIKKEERTELIKNLYSMLEYPGKMIFEIRLWNDRWKDVIKCYLYWLIGKAKEFGDIPQRHNSNHHFTKSQIEKLFSGYNYQTIKSIITVTKSKEKKKSFGEDGKEIKVKFKRRVQLIIRRKCNIIIARPFPSQATKVAKKHFNNKGIRAVEIGVRYGENVKSMLKELNINKIYLLDYPEQLDRYDSYEKTKEVAINELKKFRDKIEWSSQEEIKNINNIDFVHINRNEHLAKDIKIWWKKLNHGGILSGRDTNNLSISKLILNFANKHRVKIFNIGTEWIMIKK